MYRLVALLLVILFSLSLAIIVVWELSPTFVLGIYNKFTVETGKGDGQAIIDSQTPQYHAPLEASPICFRHVVIDEHYHTEGASVADIDNDGLNDIVAGNYWYQAPHWDKHLIFQPESEAIQILRPSDIIKSKPNGELWSGRIYSDSFFVFPDDVNQDGAVDSIVVNRTGSKVNWFENPGSLGKPWAQHSVTSFTRNESPFFADVLNLGKPQLVTGIAPQRIANGELVALEWLKSGRVETHSISSQSEGLHNNGALYSHGLGAGDINGDGLIDIAFGTGAGFADPNDLTSIKRYSSGGWYEQQVSEGVSTWAIHPIEPLIATSQIHVMDVSGDGKADLIAGSAHNAGLFWFEQGEKNDWQPHLIDASYTQLHASALEDLDGDGEKDIITGKTWLAHFGRSDPDEFGPAVLYWYRNVRGASGRSQFVRYLISDQVGVGRQITVDDVNGDGHKDIVIGNRNGVHIFLQDSTLSAAYSNAAHRFAHCNVTSDFADI